MLHIIPHYQWHHILQDDWYLSQDMNIMIMEKREKCNIKHNNNIICPCEQSQKANTHSTVSNRLFTS